MANFILSLRTGDGGAIFDGQGMSSVNMDSNMEYALMGLAAAHAKRKDPAETVFLDAFTQGVAWLAEREEMNDPKWSGSWWYQFDEAGNPLPSPNDGVINVRGVDTTSALFVYLLYLARRLDPASQLPSTYQRHAKAALSFLKREMMDKDGCTWSSWQQKANGEFELYKIKFTADQIDVWLGLHAGALLYGTDADGEPLEPEAERLRLAVEKNFFMADAGRYALGLFEDNTKAGADIKDFKDFGPIQCQGFAAWAWAKRSDAPGRAREWLASCAQPDGSMLCFEGDRKYGLSGAYLGLANAALDLEAPLATFKWLTTPPMFDPASGAVADTEIVDPDAGPAYYTPNAGVTALSLLGWPAFE